MEVKEALKNRRTVRLYQQKNVPDSDLAEMIDAARVTSCASNLQQLRYIVIRDSKLVKEIFPLTAWANLVRPSRTPESGISAPRCFIAVIASASANQVIYADAGAAIQSMQLMAWSKGLGCCWLGSIQRDKLKILVELPDDKQVLYLVAVGYPAEKPVAEDVPDGKSVFYYLDEQKCLHIPKIRLEDVATWR